MLQYNQTEGNEPQQRRFERTAEIFMLKNGIELRPAYWASVSGGKDSLYMLYLILHNLDKYPLDGVIHFELEIDYPFIKNVVDYMESECKKHGILFVRIKPRVRWIDLYNKWGYPSRQRRWCNSAYKLDAKKQLEEWMHSLGKYAVCYIGYCLDEEKRWSTRKGNITERYPLVEERVLEDDIREWAKRQTIFNNYYISNRRCGCMGCPMSSRMEFAYLFKYYPDIYEKTIERMRETEKRVTLQKGRPFAILSGNPKYNAEYLNQIIRTKWVYKLNDIEMLNEEYF